MTSRMIVIAVLWRHRMYRLMPVVVKAMYTDSTHTILPESFGQLCLNVPERFQIMPDSQTIDVTWF